MPTSPVTSMGATTSSRPGTSASTRSLTRVSRSPDGEMSLSSTGADTDAPARTTTLSATVMGVLSAGAGRWVTTTSPRTPEFGPLLMVYDTVWVIGERSGWRAEMRSQRPSMIATSSCPARSAEAWVTTSSPPAGSRSLASTSTTPGAWS